MDAARDELHQLIDQLPDHEVASMLAMILPAVDSTRHATELR